MRDKGINATCCKSGFLLSPFPWTPDFGTFRKGKCRRNAFPLPSEKRAPLKNPVTVKRFFKRQIPRMISKPPPLQPAHGRAVGIHPGTSQSISRRTSLIGCFSACIQEGPAISDTGRQHRQGSRWACCCSREEKPSHSMGKYTFHHNLSLLYIIWTKIKGNCYPFGRRRVKSAAAVGTCGY